MGPWELKWDFEEKGQKRRKSFTHPKGGLEGDQGKKD